MPNHLSVPRGINRAAHDRSNPPCETAFPHNAVRGALEVPPGENIEILVRNPRTPLDLSLGLMKNLLTRDPKNLSNNQEVSDTIRQLALRMYKQKMEEANEK